LLGILATGCSTTGTSSVATVPSTSSSQATSHGVLADRQAAFGLAKPIARAVNTRTGWISRARRADKPALIYWADFYNNTIDVFPAQGANPPLLGQITNGVSFPERLFVDAGLNLYATNVGNNTITAYRQHGKKPFLTISNGVEGPTGLTVDAAGTVYCANTANGTITEYAAGQTSPSLTIQMPQYFTPQYLAMDSSDNLYVAYSGGPKYSGVMEFPVGSTTGKDLGLTIGYAAALEVDKAGNIVIADMASNEIDVFPPGQTTPSKQIAVTAGTPFALSLDAAETDLYVTVQAGAGFIVQDVAYPNGTTMENKITASDGGWPIAVSPDTVL
jgi:hypothetical protein